MSPMVSVSAVRKCSGIHGGGQDGTAGIVQSEGKWSSVSCLEEFVEVYGMELRRRSISEYALGAGDTALPPGQGVAFTSAPPPLPNLPLPPLPGLYSAWCSIRWG
ncbi:hypothetical protein E2C01_041986 [Portunus trituberculatus]|uniref:Uncharacterized protein n=1 Tax=Portunus trituberculatus TaxID=210409 RepID=A0A5B7FTC3_PORTR|nr:hypothetical protein [Portunus trituberculatus]